MHKVIMYERSVCTIQTNFTIFYRWSFFDSYVQKLHLVITSCKDYCFFFQKEIIELSIIYIDL